MYTDKPPYEELEETMCTNCLPDLERDPTAVDAASEAFAQRLLETFNGAAITLMMSVGHRTGLFDTLAELKDATSEELAEAAGLNERYVREWLGAMTTGRIVEYHGDTRRYALPYAHAAWLTRASASDNLAVFAQYIPVLGSVEDDIVTCFRQGGGVPYERYPRFHAVMEEDSGQSILSTVDTHLLPLAPGLDEQLREGIEVLDVGCGRGRVVNKLARLFPNSRFVGYDLSEEAIAYARATAEREGNRNAHFEVRDLTSFAQDALPEAFDFVTAFDAIHDQANPAGVLAGIARTLKPGGIYLMQDIRGSSDVAKNRDHLLGPLLYTISCLHCMTVSLAQGGAGLGAMWGEEKAVEMLREAGLTQVEIHRLDHDIQNNYYVVRH
jgi:2-polyprenyl-3-methyl-5-hydroxy-6-metoxy-1,4-benzoquinol methylase